MASSFVGLVPDLNFVTGAGAPKSKIQFNGVGGLLTYIGFANPREQPQRWAEIMDATQGADDMSDRDEWISYSHCYGG